jgi:capsular polysaccharide export protein
MKDGAQARPLFCFNGGFFTNPRVRRILALSGYDVQFGKPSSEDLVGVWGKSPTSSRGETVAEITDAQLVHIEDALLRSVHLGRDGDAPLGLTVDTQRPFFDSSGPSDLEGLLATSPFDDTAILDRARRAMTQLRDVNLSKYNDFPLNDDVPEPGYVLVIDQTRDDASVTYGGASVGTFREMLVFAREEHPNARIVVKSHPDVLAGHRQGHFDDGPMGPNMELFSEPVSPYVLLEGAIAVYTVSSGMGFEAILSGHRPIVFGQPFYAGWGLTDDRQPIDRRRRVLTKAQLFAGVMIDYPKWYDPYRDCLCELETVIDTLAAQARAAREDRGGYVFRQISQWKRPALRSFFGDVRFKGTGREVVWASKDLDGEGVMRVEDGFIRSKGLGADLVAPMSLVLDDLGIYFDPTRESRLERMIADAVVLTDYQRLRAEKLRASLVRHGLSKYNLGGDLPNFDADVREVILVPGQVEDDASILRGAGAVRTNAELLAAVRRDFPEAFIIYKPHPDVEAGLREGYLEGPDADLVADGAEINGLLGVVDRVTTMTSLTGFEALLRGVRVSCYGVPFYAGWGLTDDTEGCDRRDGRVDLDSLVHACLIDYPRYFDPVTKTACPVEVIVDRLAQGEVPLPRGGNRLLAKLQGIFASYAHLWR